MKFDEKFLSSVGVSADQIAQIMDAHNQTINTLSAQFAEENSDIVKRKLVEKYYSGFGLSGKSLDIVMRGSAKEIEKAELKNGEIMDYSAFEKLANGVFYPLISGGKTKQEVEADKKQKKKEILSIKDTTKRQAEIAANIELFRN